MKLLRATLLAFVLVGCSTNQLGTPAFDTPLATSLPKSSSTALPVTPSASSMPQWLSTCRDITTGSLSDFASEGMVVMNRREKEGVSQAVLLEMKTGTVSPLEDKAQYLVGISVSPNGRWLAYGLNPVNNNKGAGLIYFQEQYGVRSADGRQNRVFSREVDWRTLSHWLDNDRVVFGGFWSQDTEDRTRPLIIVNPFTQEKLPLPPEFPEIYSRDHLFPVPEWENYIGDTTYDATLTRAVYVRIRGQGITEYVLWDTQTDRELAALQSPYINQTPKWSPDNSQFVVVAYLASRNAPESQPEFFSVTRDGTIEQLTHFAADHRVADISGYTWSPNGRYLAFWYISPDPLEERLAILDVVTRETQDSCIQGDMGGPPTGGFDVLPSQFTRTVPAPIWSPDSHQIIVENRYAADTSRVILVDIFRGMAAEIGKNMMPVGWMTSD